jgi:three-Cys-motif partner protein
MLFIEQRPDRFAHLQAVLTPHLSQVAQSPNVRVDPPRQGDCDAVLHAMLDELEKKQISFGPALAFLDQFGYGAVSMDLIRRVMLYGQCEVFTYLDYKDMNRWITDPKKSAAFARAFGGDEWKQCIDLPEGSRRTRLLEEYKRALKDPHRGKAKYVTSFLMYDRNDTPLYWLLFCTNNLRGLEEMKRAMWSVDKTGSFRFSDKDDPGQLRLLDESYSQEWLAEDLATKLAGRTMTVAQVKEFVLSETPPYLFKPALKSLETSRCNPLIIVQQPNGRKAGTYPDEMLEQIIVTFPKSLFGFLG